MKHASLKVFGVCAIALCVLASCGKATAANESKVGTKTAKEAPQNMKIAIMTMGLHQPYFVALSKGYKDMAAEYPGVKVEIVEVDPNADAAKQVSAIENLQSLNAQALIITAIDPKVVNPAIEEAMRSGIKIVSHYNLLSAQDIHSGISNYGMGYVAGQMAADWINKKLGGAAEVALLVWEKTDFDIKRTDGMQDALKQFAPGAKVVAKQAADSVEKGLNVSESILQAHPKVKVFVCYNDEGGLGALSAIEGAGLAKDDVGIFGVNASPEALTKIKEGKVFRGTASIDPYNHGRLEMEMTIRLLLGHFLPSSMEIKPVPVSMENAAKFQ